MRRVPFAHARVQEADGERTRERQPGTEGDDDRQNFRRPEIVREKKLGRLTEKIEERLGYCDACERCDVKGTRFRKHL